jgi:hypothetical protein
MEKLPDTRTNEARKNVDDDKYAKFRADKMKVILIFDIKNPDCQIDSIDNPPPAPRASFLIYKKGEIILPDGFDEDVDKICSQGIHYFKTLDAAYFWAFGPVHDENGKLRWSEDYFRYSDPNNNNRKCFEEFLSVQNTKTN